MVPVINSRPSLLKGVCAEFLPLVAIETPAVPSLTDAWISGFTDAEGNFSLTVPSNGSRPYVHFHLDQNFEQELLSFIINLFGGDGTCYQRKNTNCFRMRISNNFALVNVRAYFTRFPLKTNKQGPYTAWCSAHDILIAEPHLSSKSYLAIVNIKTGTPDIDVDDSDDLN